MPGIKYSLFLVTSIYLALTLIVILLMKRQIAALQNGNLKQSSHD